LTQEPIADALVRVVDARHDSVMQIITTLEGKFRLGPIEEGTYDIFISHIAYKRIRIKSYTIYAGEIAALSLALSTTVIYEVPVVVAVSRMYEKALEAPASVAVVGAETIGQRVALTPAEHVRGLAGVDNVTKGIVQE
jgi:hypothetical protein